MRCDIFGGEEPSLREAELQHFVWGNFPQWSRAVTTSLVKPSPPEQRSYIGETSPGAGLVAAMLRGTLCCSLAPDCQDTFPFELKLLHKVLLLLTLFSQPYTSLLLGTVLQMDIGLFGGSAVSSSLASVFREGTEKAFQTVGK